MAEHKSTQRHWPSGEEVTPRELFTIRWSAWTLIALVLGAAYPGFIGLILALSWFMLVVYGQTLSLHPRTVPTESHPLLAELEKEFDK